MRRVLLTGGQHYSNRDVVFNAQDWARDTWGVSVVIHPGSTGIVDAAAIAWCQLQGVPAESHECAANSVEVLDQFRPDVTFHFLGDDSLAWTAHEAGVEVSQLQ